ncbi:MAG: hypothetical protein QOH71_724 [Blastocatellia bacterium]|jgi:hypothetical protein|nr:hypothetical protein [Blastocatellia bacterium]
MRREDFAHLYPALKRRAKLIPTLRVEDFDRRFLPFAVGSLQQTHGPRLYDKL